MIIAKFIGKDGSQGFKKNKTYFLEVPDTARSEWKIIIQNANGAEWCPYSNLESFLMNWEVIKVIRERA